MTSIHRNNVNSYNYSRPGTVVQRTYHSKLHQFEEGFEYSEASFIVYVHAKYILLIKGNLERNHSWESDGWDSN